MHLILKEIHPHLVGTAYYETMLDPETCTVMVPEKFYCESFSPKTLDEIIHVWDVLRFWGARLPAEFYKAILYSTVLKQIFRKNIDFFREKFEHHEDLHSLIYLSEFRPNNWILESARCGCLALFADIRGFEIKEKYWEAMAESGSIELLQYVRKHHAPPTKHVCRAAAVFGRLEFLQELRRGGCPWDETTIASAAIHGHVDVLRFAFEQGCPAQDFSTFSHSWTAPFMVQDDEYWQECGEDEPVTLLELAAGNGHLECMRYLYVMGGHTIPSPNVYVAAIAHFECLELLIEWWAFDHEGMLDSMPFVAAISNGGDLELLERLHHLDVFPLDGVVVIAAVYEGNAPCLEYSLDNLVFGIAGNQRREAYLTAIRDGRLDLLHMLFQYLQRDDEFDNDYCQYAAWNVQMLQFLHERGFLWNSKTLQSAIEYRNLPCFEYALEHGCFLSKSVESAARAIGYLS